MASYTYKKINYLDDPYQQYLMNKEKSESAKENNSKFLSPNTVSSSPKKDNRTTKLLLDVNEFGVFSNIPNSTSGSLTPPSSGYINNMKNSANKGMLNSSSADSSSLKINTSTDTIKAEKHASFVSPLLDMKFEVGGLFGDGEKSGDDLFGDILSKFDKMDIDTDFSLDDKNQNRLSQDTIRMKHDSTISVGTIKASDSLKKSGTIKASNTIKAIREKHSSQDTIKLVKENSVKKVDSFDNQLVENLNANPAIVIDKTFLSNDNDNDDLESNRGFDPDIYKDDDKIDYTTSGDWDNPWRGDNNKNTPSSMKSSQSKLSAFSSFTLKSSKKFGKMTKKFYKKLMKPKDAPQYPSSPLDIPSTYNEKERAFEEMMLRDDTISLSLSNPNGSLTSTFADKTFPLTEEASGDADENNTEKENAMANGSFVSSNGSEDGEDMTSKKRRHRNGINFEEALKEGNGFRVSLANM